MARDTIRHVDNQYNLYEYVWNDPINRIDMTGFHGTHGDQCRFNRAVGAGLLCGMACAPLTPGGQIVCGVACTVAAYYWDKSEPCSEENDHDHDGIDDDLDDDGAGTCGVNQCCN